MPLCLLYWSTYHASVNKTFLSDCYSSLHSTASRIPGSGFILKSLIINLDVSSNTHICTQNDTHTCLHMCTHMYIIIIRSKLECIPLNCETSTEFFRNNERLLIVCTFCKASFLTEIVYIGVIRAKISFFIF